MARKRKHNTHVDLTTPDEDVERPDETIDSFLRDMHQETSISATAASGNKEVVGVGSGGESVVASDVAGGQTIPSLKFLKEHFQTKSAAIRYLNTQNIPTKVIAKHLNIKYQHVRNVLTTTLKRGPNESHEIRPQSNQVVETSHGDD